MNLHEQPTNTAGRASSGMERTRWRAEGVDPELVADPYDVAQAAQQEREEEARTKHLGALSAERPLSHAVADSAMRPQEYVHHPGQIAVQRSFGEL